MEKFQLATAQDLREAAIIEKKRRYEEERKKRIFDSKNRIYGMDYEALNAQIQEKNRIKDAEKQRELAFIKEEQRRSDVIREKEYELQKERRRIMNDINEFRATFQKKEDRREYDLNGPNNDIPSRAGDNDVRIGISSAQKFMGEDLMAPERRKAQGDQQRAWLTQQIAERRQAENDRKQAEKATMEALMCRDQRALDLEEIEKNTRRQLLEATARFNAKLAADQEYKRIEKKRQENEDNLAEMYNCLTSDMLTESPSLANSNFGPKHKITTAYKGMTTEERERLREQQIHQASEDKRRNLEEKLNEERWIMVAKNTDRKVILKDRETERKQRAIDADIREENRRLAEEQKINLEYLNNVVYTNRPTEEYYENFNTTTR